MRKLTPQEHLENIIIQQNKDQPVNQYTALLWNEGKAGFERPGYIVDYGEYMNREDLPVFQAITSALLLIFAPLMIFVWVLLDWGVVNFIGCRNNKSTICVFKNEDGMWAVVGLGFIMNVIVTGAFGVISSANGGTLGFWGISLLLNLIGLAWVILAESVNALVSLAHLKTLEQS
jgi:hypothetical protein